MKAEKQKILFDKYPKIFRQKDLSMDRTCMCWGIECGNGWFSLIDNLCDYIQGMSDNNPHLIDTQLEASQVKEKYGGLRFYTNWVPIENHQYTVTPEYRKSMQDQLEGAISFAEHLSATICETCGQPGTRNDSGWITTLCEECREEYNKEKN